MISDISCNQDQGSCFVELLKRDLPDPRDNRGNRHSWVFVRVAVVLATLTGRQTLSSIHRFIRPRLDWLHELTPLPKGRSIARAQLPRLLARLDGSVLDQLIERGVGVRLQNRDGQPWVAVDGKTRRGTLDAGEQQGLVVAITHETRAVVGQARPLGPQSSAIPVVRALLREPGVEKQQVTLAAHPCNPKTTAPVPQAGAYS